MPTYLLVDKIRWKKDKEKRNRRFKERFIRRLHKIILPVILIIWEFNLLFV
jgi:hypothetical protein